MSLDIIPISAFQDNYIWLFRDPEHPYAIVIDPGDAQPVIAYLAAEGLQLKAILITHHHADHAGGLPRLKQLYPAAVSYGPGDPRIAGLDAILKDETPLNLPEFNLQFNILFTPGHTLTHLCYYSNQGILLCGDTLFAAGCGRLFEGTPQQMFHSLQRLKSLPSDTAVYCAHEYTLKNLKFAATVEPNNSKITEKMLLVNALMHSHKPSLPSSIATELEVNPFFRCEQPQVIEFAMKNGANSIEPLEVFTVLRKCKDQF